MRFFLVPLASIALFSLSALPCPAQPAAPAEPVLTLPVAVQQLAGGFRFVEGPVWNSRGFYLFSDIPANTLWKCTPEGKTAIVRQPSGHSNGNAYDAQNRLIACEQDRRVSRKTPDGTFQTIADAFEGHKLNAPNDLALFRDGSVFFSDPSYGCPPDKRELDFQGLYRLRPSGKLELLDKEWQQPNGLCFSPDFKRLYVDDSQAGQIFVYDVNDAGDLSNKTLFASIPKPGDPDGMKCDARGRLFVAAPGGVRVYESSGALLGLIAVSKDPANLCFGGARNEQLFITVREAVYLCDVSKLETRTGAPN